MTSRALSGEIGLSFEEIGNVSSYYFDLFDFRGCGALVGLLGHG